MKKLTKLLIMAALSFALLPSNALAASNSCSCQCSPSGAAAPSSPPSSLPDLIFYRPFLAMQEEMDRLNQDMNHAMQEAFYTPGNFDLSHQQNFARINMETTPKEYRITMTTPGLDEKDMKVEVSQDHTLTIHSEKNMVQKTGTGSGPEHSFESFTQMLTLPPDADADHIQTSYKDGEYTVTLPRKAADPQHSSEKSEGHDRSL